MSGTTSSNCGSAPASDRPSTAGIARSRFGVVVLSGSFFGKGWPAYELDGLVNRRKERRRARVPDLARKLLLGVRHRRRLHRIWRRARPNTSTTITVRTRSIW